MVRSLRSGCCGTRPMRSVRIANLIQERAKTDGWATRDPVGQQRRQAPDYPGRGHDRPWRQVASDLPGQHGHLGGPRRCGPEGRHQGHRLRPHDEEQQLEVFIGFDNDVIGDVIAKYAVERVSKGNSALINDDQADNNAVVYRDGQGHDPVVHRMVRHFRQEKGKVT